MTRVQFAPFASYPTSLDPTAVESDQAEAELIRDLLLGAAAVPGLFPSGDPSRFAPPGSSDLSQTDLSALLVMWALEQQDQRPGRMLGTSRPRPAHAMRRVPRTTASELANTPASAPANASANVPAGGPAGDRLASAAERGLNPGDKGKCATYVRQALAASGLVPSNVAFRSAHQWADYLAGNSNFREISVSSDQLARLPRGAVIVWGGVPGSHEGGAREHGHIAIAKGDGTELSYDNRRQTTSGWGTNFGGHSDPQGRTFRVFVPVG